MSGRVLALDHGTSRVGVAISDPLRITASPLEVVDAAVALQRIQEIVSEYRPEIVVVGLPVSLDGAENAAAMAARRFGEAVGEATGLPVEFVDERFTSHTAEKALLEGGLTRRDRRRKIDKVAAAVILRSYLDARS